MPPVIVIGASGQDGTLLCEQLEKSGRPTLKIEKGQCDFNSQKSIQQLFMSQERHDIFFLAAIHRSSESVIPVQHSEDFRRSLDLHAVAPFNLLDEVRRRGAGDRFFYASSSRVFGSPLVTPQNEDTPRNPLCIYGTTKSAGMDVCRYYRENYDVFACSGILYNHESILRNYPFLSKKVCHGAVLCSKGLMDKLVLTNLSARVDWSYAPDVVQAMIMILQGDTPTDLVISSSKVHSVENFAEIAFAEVGLDWRRYVSETPPPASKQSLDLVGDNSLLKARIPWKETVTFEQMVRIMVRNELQNLQPDND